MKYGFKTLSSVASCLALGMSMMMGSGCDSDGVAVVGGGELVTVAGFVYNTDLTGFPATGVRVYLLNNGDEYSTTADATTGAFSIQVPAGSKFWLVTDDNTTATADDWQPLINIDTTVAEVPANGLTNVLIHACPSAASTAASSQTGFASSSTPLGSVAVWDNFLTNGDAAGRYVPTTTNGSGGVVSMIFFKDPTTDPGALPNQVTFHANEISVTMDEADEFGPIAYADGSTFLPAALFPFTPGLSTNEHALPATTTKTGQDSLELGMVWAFGDPDYSGETVTLNFADQKASRNLTFTSSPLTVPVKDAHITLIFVGVGAQTDVSFMETFCLSAFPTGATFQAAGLCG